jgi:hypothetical protein
MGEGWDRDSGWLGGATACGEGEAGARLAWASEKGAMQGVVRGGGS